MKRILSLTLAVCLLLCTCLCGCGDDGTGGGFRFPLEAEPKGLDPQTATDTAAVTVIATLFEGLTAINADGSVVDGAATHTVSEDGKTYTFTLKESYWSTLKIKGEETGFEQPVMVTAYDFLFGIQRGVDPVTASPLAAEYDPIQNAAAIRRGEKPLSALGVKAVDERTLVITLEKADPTFPARLAGTPYMPCQQEFFESTGGRYGLEKEYILTNGAFWLSAWNHDESLLMYQNEHYHGDVAPEAVRYVIGVEDPVTSLQNGNLDAAPTETPLGGGITAYPLQDSLRSLYFNTTTDPFTAPAIRTALRDSVEWQAVHRLLTEQGDTEVLAGGFVPPDGIVGGETYRTDANTLTAMQSDVAGAKAALQNGLDVLQMNNLPKFELLAAEDTLSADIARYLVQSWQKNLNVYPTLTLLPESELNQRVNSGNYQAAICIRTATGLSGAENLSCYASNAAGNLSRLSSAAVDAAIQTALCGGRTELEALEKLLWQTCPAVPISAVTRYYAVGDNVKHVYPRPFGGGRWNAPLYFRDALKFD